MSELIAWAVPVFLVTLALEAVPSARPEAREVLYDAGRGVLAPEAGLFRLDDGSLLLSADLSTRGPGTVVATWTAKAGDGGNWSSTHQLHDLAEVRLSVTETGRTQNQEKVLVLRHSSSPLGCPALSQGSPQRRPAGVESEGACRGRADRFPKPRVLRRTRYCPEGVLNRGRSRPTAPSPEERGIG